MEPSRILLNRARRLARQYGETILIVRDPVYDPPQLFLLRASRRVEEPWIEDGDIVAEID